jgi:tetratricopeptide (TPR) repeat protein
MYVKMLDSIQITINKLLDGQLVPFRSLQDPRNVQRLVFGYLALLVGYILAVKLATPIFRTDTDMWYHMNGGRYFWTMGEVPSTTFFSFIEPKREWVNYFWGFQAIIYQIYDFVGYQGLVVFRALMNVLTVVVVLAYIFADQKSREKPALFVILGSLFVVILNEKAPGIRPHLFSYLFIVLFLYILEYRPKLAPVLPVIMVIWVNVHGVEWVISALIGGAYLIEYLVTNRKQGKRWLEMVDRYSVSIVACSLALLINPFGINVLTASFAHDHDIFLFISELSEVNPAVLYSFTFSLAGMGVAVAVTFIAAIELLGLVLLIKAGRLRISHTLLALGGVVLIFNGVRFVWEWLLLSLPFVHAVVSEYSYRYGKRWNSNIKRILVVGYFALIPFVNMAPVFAKYPYYPFDERDLPTKMVSFLNDNNAKGNILAGPVDAGYLEWGLYPNVLIYSDMEFPPFEAMQVFMINWSLKSANVFSKMLDQYKVDYIVALSSASNFKKVISSFPQYVPVFVDDSRILYANKESQSQLTNQYEIKKIDPYNLSGKGISDEQLVEELKRLFDLNPDDRRINRALAKTLFDLKRYAEAMVYAERYSDLYPNDPNSHYWVGKILENTDRCDLADRHYKEALKHSRDSFATTVKNHIASCAYYQKNFDEAYKWFRESMNPYLIHEDDPHMYQYAYSTAIVGDTDDAIKLLDMLLLTLDPKKEDLKAKAEKLRADLRSSDVSNLGIGSWLRSLVE